MNMKTLLNIFSKDSFEVLSDILKERLLDQGCAPYLRSVLLSVLRRGLFVRGYTTCLKEYREEET